MGRGGERTKRNVIRTEEQRGEKRTKRGQRRGGADGYWVKRNKRKENCEKLRTRKRKEVKKKKRKSRNRKTRREREKDETERSNKKRMIKINGKKKRRSGVGFLPLYDRTPPLSSPLHPHLPALPSSHPDADRSQQLSNREETDAGAVVMNADNEGFAEAPPPAQCHLR